MDIEKLLEELEKAKPLIEIGNLTREEVEERLARTYDEFCLSQSLQEKRLLWLKYWTLAEELEELVGMKEAEKIRTEIVKMAR